MLRTYVLCRPPWCPAATPCSSGPKAPRKRNRQQEIYRIHRQTKRKRDITTEIVTKRKTDYKKYIYIYIYTYIVYIYIYSELQIEMHLNKKTRTSKNCCDPVLFRPEGASSPA